MKRAIEICIISDVHLGTYGCHAKELLNYLKSIKPKVLILNGDFFDIWQFNKKWFPAEHVKVVQRIMKMAMGGTKVFYITGNHDDALRRYSGFSIGYIHRRDSLVIQVGSEQHWVFHRDVFYLADWLAEIVLLPPPLEQAKDFIGHFGWAFFDWHGYYFYCLENGQRSVSFSAKGLVLNHKIGCYFQQARSKGSVK